MCRSAKALEITCTSKINNRSVREGPEYWRPHMSVSSSNLSHEMWGSRNSGAKAGASFRNFSDPRQYPTRLFVCLFVCWLAFTIRKYIQQWVNFSAFSKENQNRAARTKSDLSPLIQGRGIAISPRRFRVPAYFHFSKFESLQMQLQPEHICRRHS